MMLDYRNLQILKKQQKIERSLLKQSRNVQPTKTLAFVSDFVNKDFSRYDGTKWEKKIIQVWISKILGQMINEKIAAFRALFLR